MPIRRLGYKYRVIPGKLSLIVPVVDVVEVVFVSVYYKLNSL